MCDPPLGGTAGRVPSHAQKVARPERRPLSVRVPHTDTLSPSQFSHRCRVRRPSTENRTVSSSPHGERPSRDGSVDPVSPLGGPSSGKRSEVTQDEKKRGFSSLPPPSFYLSASVTPDSPASGLKRATTAEHCAVSPSSGYVVTIELLLVYTRVQSGDAVW